VKLAVHGGAELTQRLLALSRKQPLCPKRVDLGAIAASMIELLRRSLGEEIAMTLDLAPALWPALAGPGQVETAVLNMALNSRDAMPSGGDLIIATRTRIIAQGDRCDLAAGDYVVLSVTDTGTGMSPEVLSCAFEPFFTTKELGKRLWSRAVIDLWFCQTIGAMFRSRARWAVGRPCP